MILAGGVHFSSTTPTRSCSASKRLEQYPHCIYCYPTLGAVTLGESSTDQEAPVLWETLGEEQGAARSQPTTAPWHPEQAETACGYQLPRKS